jgi:hypothetical protein
MYSYRLPALLLFLFTNILSTSGQEIVWARQSDDVAFLEGVATIKMELDADENLYVLYSLRNRVKFQGMQFESVGSSDILLIKYNAQGSILWTRQIGGSSWDQGNDIAIDGGNNVLITGIMPNGGSFLGKTLDINNGGAFFAKITSDGNLEWVRQYGNKNGQGNAITSDRFNNVIIGGASDLNNQVVAKYTADGTLLWTTPMVYHDCCVRPSITDIKTDANENIIVVGDFTGGISFAGKSLRAPLFYSVFIFKINTNGNYIWSNQIDPGGWSLNDAMSKDMQIDSSGDIFLTGHFNDIATLGAITLNEQQEIDDRTGFLTRISSSGNFLWAKAMYGRDMMPSSLTINPNTNEVNVCGSSLQRFAYDDQYISSLNQNQSFVLTTDVAGNFKSCMIMSPEKSYASYVSHTAFNSDNEFYVAGIFGKISQSDALI